MSLCTMPGCQTTAGCICSRTLRASPLGEQMRLVGLRKENARAWAEVDRLRAALRCEAKSGTCVMVHNPDRSPCTAENCAAMRDLDKAKRA